MLSPKLLCCLIGLVALGLAATTGGEQAWADDAIIIDHKCTKLEAIPDYWIEQAKLNITIHYAHTSHGSQVNSGAERLESIDSWYSFARRASSSEGLPGIETPPALRMYDGNPPETYITPEDYWSTEAGRVRTRNVAATGNYDYSMWSWCGQQSSNSESTTQSYLDVMDGFESTFSEMRFILMTGHTDGSGEDGNLNARNNQVRNYARANGMVLFDFADIESYNPDWEYFLDKDCTDYGLYDGGNWPAEWCAANPGSDLCASCSCAHSQSLICNLKGRAFWWMMARLAGWEGTTQADFDWDGDVDLADYEVFGECFAGPEATPAPLDASTEDCLEAFDSDADGDVDVADFASFQAQFGKTHDPCSVPDTDSGAGQVAFTASCASCHGANGSGGVGPNLQSNDPWRSLHDALGHGAVHYGKTATAEQIRDIACWLSQQG